MSKVWENSLCLIYMCFHSPRTLYNKAVLLSGAVSKGKSLRARRPKDRPRKAHLDTLALIKVLPYQPKNNTLPWD